MCLAMNSQIAEAIEATEAMKPSRCPKPQVQYPVATKYPSNILADSSGRCSTNDFEGVFGGDTNTPESTEKKEMTMAIIKCTECGKEISDKAATCPSCGAPVAGIQATAQEKNSFRSTRCYYGLHRSDRATDHLHRAYCG